MTLPEAVNVCPNRQFTFDAKGRGLVIHLIKNEWCNVGSIEYLVLGFSHSVADKCGFGRVYCVMPVIFDKLPNKIVYPLLYHLSYI